MVLFFTHIPFVVNHTINTTPLQWLPQQYLLEKNVSIDEAKLFDKYQNLFEFVQRKHQPNAIYCKMMGHERWAKYFAIFNTIK